MNRPALFCLLLTLPFAAACEHLRIFEPYRETSCLQRVRLSLADAVFAAEADGGRALDADYRQDEEMGCLQGHTGFYDVTLLNAGRIVVVSVDAGSGRLGPRTEASVMNALMGSGNRFEGSPADMARQMPGMRMDLTAAVMQTQEAGGKPMAAWVENRNGVPGYAVKLLENGRVRMTWIAGT